MRYSAALDGIRGIAVLTVVLAHFGVPWLRRGGLGVDIFFTLSGFLITTILLHEFSRTGDINFRNFYLRRTLRLLPALFLLLGVYGAVAFFYGRDLHRHLADIALVFFYVANWAAAAGLNRPGELGHTWSLSVEEQFYIVWPCLFYFLLKRWGRVGLLAGSLSLAALSMTQTFAMAGSFPWWRMYYGSDTRAFMLLSGCCFAVAVHFWRERVALPKVLEAVLPLVTATGVAYLMLHRSSLLIEPGYFRGRIFLMPLLTCGLLYQVVMPGFENTKKVLGLRPLVYFGKRSYGLYLWHYWIMNFWLMDVSKNAGVPVVLAWAAASLVLTELSYRCIELPFLSLKERFSAGRQRTDLVADTAAEPAAARAGFGTGLT